MRCPACHHDNPDAVKFCGECGTRLDARCPACGASNPAANKFCHECGESLRVSHRHITAPPLAAPPVVGPPLAAPPFAPPLATPQLTGERRHATIVFSDLAGYTAMNERLDPEEVEALLGRIKEAAVAIVERHGGMVNQFVGDEVLALFGIPLAHEDDPLRAVRAALELHELVRAMSPEVEERIGQPLRMHTGIHTGLIVTNQRDDRDGRIGIVGNTVNLGARLKVLAAADDILVSPETQRAIGAFFDTQALDALSVKGKSEPVVPHRVVAPAKTRTRFEAVARRGLAPHVGRAAELATLRAGLDAACAGQGRVVTLSGEAGMGKSRLLHELRAAVDENEVAVLQGSCLAYGDSTSYLPFLDAMHGLFDLREDDDPGAMVAKVVAAVEALDTGGPALHEHVPLYLHLLSLRSPAHPLPEHLTGEVLQHAAEEALAELFLASAERRPVVLLLEDWHWTDEASAAALLHLGGRVAGARLLVVVTHRPDRPTWPADWQAQGSYIRIDLGALTLVPTRMLMAARIAARELPDELIAVIHERTGGNPFFVEELCRALMEEGALVVRDGCASLTQPLEELLLPDTVQSIIRTRLDRLDAGAKDVLRLASVIGRRFGRRLLAELYEDHARLDAVLASLVALDLLQETHGGPDVEYMFRQALTQEVAYDSLRIEQRKALHALVGNALEALHAARLEEHVNLLLHHFRRAEVWPSAIAYGQRAAERAAALSQFQRAISVLEDVQAWVAHLPDDEQRAGLLIDVLLREERLYETLGRRHEQQAVIDRLFDLLASAERAGGGRAPSDGRAGTGGRAETAGAAGRLAEVYVRQGDLHTQLGRYEDAERALDQALARRQALGDPAGEAHVLRSMGFLRWHQGRYDEAVGCNEAALAIDRRREDPAAMAMDLTNLGAVLRNIGDHARARDCLEEAQELYQAVGRPARQAFTLYSIANIARDLGDLDLAMAQYQRAHEIFTEHGDHVMSTRALAAMAGIHWETGDAEESIRLSRDVVHVTREAAYGPGLSHALHTLAERLSASGEHAAAVPYLLESVEVFSKLGERHSEAEVWERLARAYEQHLDDARQAVAAWDHVSALRLQIRDRAGAMSALQEMARIAREKLRAPHEALAHLERALELAGELGGLAKQGEIRNAMGIVAWRLEDYPAALAHYERARTCFRELGSPAHEGFILNSIGVTLHKLGRLDEALASLDEALALHRQTDQRLFAGHALAAMGDIHRERGAFDLALRAYQTSLELRRDIGDRRGEAWMHGALAQVHAARADRERMRVHVLAARAVLSHHPDEELGRVLDALSAGSARAGDS
jgi:class 3 adenylate cyclase/tetratricopeptide (TPR) repeat protein